MKSKRKAPTKRQMRRTSQLARLWQRMTQPRKRRIVTGVYSSIRGCQASVVTYATTPDRAIENFMKRGPSAHHIVCGRSVLRVF